MENKQIDIDPYNEEIWEDTLKLSDADWFAELLDKNMDFGSYLKNKKI